MQEIHFELAIIFLHEMGLFFEYNIGRQKKGSLEYSYYILIPLTP